MAHFLFGNLTWESFPHQWFTIGATGTIVFGGVALVSLLTYFKRWKWLWKEWLTSTDPKRIGVMYIAVAFVMFLRGGLDALMIWLQQSLASGNTFAFLGSQHGYLSADHFQQLFTALGDFMVFFL